MKPNSLKPNFKIEKSVEDSLDTATNLMQKVCFIIYIATFFGVFALMMNSEIIIVFAVLGATIVTLLAFALINPVIQYFRVQSEMSRTLKQINAKLIKEDTTQ